MVVGDGNASIEIPAKFILNLLDPRWLRKDVSSHCVRRKPVPRGESQYSFASSTMAIGHAFPEISRRISQLFSRTT